ncbi:hypothetical protein CRE_08360 [Caenorhabditis remanei]|uniref:Uncharacterized protein n=1 Tax=Caenorhabditis remanei TaxID=31234 RepID=E3MPM5_CAERE|nr:hypothetical protein CRE_08360 [Caenorhabditis remanei]
MANKNKKKTEQKKEKSEQWSPVTMKTIKWSITRELTRTRTLVSLANRALALERNTNNITVLDGYLAQLRNQLVLIEDLPENAIDLLKTNNKLCAQNVFEANRAQISDHLGDRGHEGLVNQMITLIGDVTTTVNNFRSGRVSAIPGTPPPPPSDVLAPGNAHTTDGIAPRRAHPEQHIPERSVDTCQLNKLSFSEYCFEDMEKDLNKYCILAYSLRSKGCRLDDSFFINSFIGKLPQQVMGTVFKKHHQKDRTFQELVGIAYKTISEKRALDQALKMKRGRITTNEVHDDRYPSTSQSRNSSLLPPDSNKGKMTVGHNKALVLSSDSNSSSD